ncbi:MAG: hypothetical protein ACKPEY_15220 [Planctomycetota bacterium]
MSRSEAAEEPRGGLTAAARQTIAARLMPSARQALINRQLRANHETRNSWTSCAAQRQQVTRLIREQIEWQYAHRPHLSPLRIAILGAGNGNDLDLEELTSFGRSPAELDPTNGPVPSRLSGEQSAAAVRLHLFDLDEGAIGSIRQRQPRANWSAIDCHAPIDLSGLDTITTNVGATNMGAENMGAENMGATEMSTAISASEQVAERVRALSKQKDFDLVVSTCLLSQIMEGVVHELGGWHDDYLPLIQQLRTEHLRLLFHCTRPGGTILFITDFVSSDSCDELHRIAPQALPELVQQLIAQRNFFTGLNPAVLARFWSSDAVTGLQVEQVRVTQPWLWNPGPRVYVVCGFIVSRVAKRC